MSRPGLVGKAEKVGDEVRLSGFASYEQTLFNDRWGKLPSGPRVIESDFT